MVAAAALTTGVAAAMGAETDGQEPRPLESEISFCQDPWSDGTTFGISCSSSYPSTYRFRAEATCENGETVTGAIVGSGETSYAYCSQVGSTYRAGTGFARRA